MSDQRPNRSEAFAKAAALPKGERESYLRVAFGDDADALQEVRDLLRFHDGSTAFLEQPAIPALVQAGEMAGADEALAAGTKIGEFVVSRVIGVGGMGVVYLAEQEYPRRTVALKLIRTGVVSAQTLRRFEREAEVLARLQHPGIAQIYEAGTAETPRGRQPYFAMEFVEGRPLLEAASSLSTRERLELMASIGDAVHHAHGKGVVHRDLKPGNILVDGAGRPKILDFGVARVTGGDHAATLRTDVGQLIGTLAYMSPEQVAGDPTQIDPRSDVYALGVILYEMLAGRLPHETNKRSVPEIVRAIREDDPPSLSSIDHRYRGDVEIIVARALEKDPARRYATAEDFAADVRRFLADEPIVARPATTLYQIRKFASRNRGLVTGLVLAMLLLIAGTTTTGIMGYRAARERDLAQASKNEAERQTQRAIHERDTSREVMELMRKMLAAADPSRGQGRGVTVEEMLDAEAKRIEGAPGLNDRPLVKAALHQTIGETYFSLGRYEDARRHTKIAWELTSQTLGEEHPEAVRAMAPYVEAVWYSAPRGESFPEVVRAAELALRVLGESHRETIQIHSTYRRMVYAREGPNAALTITERWLEIARRALGEDDPVTWDWMDARCGEILAAGRIAEAESEARRVLAIKERVAGPDSPDTLASVSHLGNALMRLKKWDEAEQCWIRLAEARRRVLGAKHAHARQSIHILAAFYQMRQDYPKAERVARELVELGRDVKEDPRILLGYQRQLAGYVEAQGRLEESADLRRQVLEGMRALANDDHHDVIRSRMELAATLALLGQFDEAETTALEAFSRAEPQLDQIGPSRMAGLAISHGRKLVRAGRFEAAAAWGDRAKPYLRSPAKPGSDAATAQVEYDRLRKEIETRTLVPEMTPIGMPR